MNFVVLVWILAGFPQCTYVNHDYLTNESCGILFSPSVHVRTYTTMGAVEFPFL